jgi:hypothetical protein
MQLLDADIERIHNGQPIPARVWLHNHEDLPAFGKILTQYHWDMVVIDESAGFRTANAQRTALLTGARNQRRLSADFKIAMTGLPVVKHALDLYPTLRWLGAWPGTKAEYCEAFLVMNEYNQEVMIKDLPALTAVIDSVRFQVPKSSVLNIPRTWRYDRVTLPKWQRESYRRIQRELATRFIDENGELHESILRSRLSELLRLHQVAAGFEAISANQWNWHDDNAKTRWLIDDILPELEGEKMIVWTVFQPEAENVTRMLRKAGRKAVAYYGSQDRGMENQESYDAWKSGKADTFVSTLAKGSTGLNLPEASTMIYHSRSQNTEHWVQGLERNYRMTTKHEELHVIVIEGDDTIDQAVTKTLGDDIRVASSLTSIEWKAVLGA